MFLESSKWRIKLLTVIMSLFIIIGLFMMFEGLYWVRNYHIKIKYIGYLF